MSTLGFAGTFLVGKILPPEVDVSNPVIAGFVMVIVWALIEAVFLSAIGNTPAKWLFGITIRRSTGKRLDFGDALFRAGLVAIQGLGLGLPFINLITQGFAYHRLRTTGTTLWDTKASLKVSHAEWTPLRAVSCVLATTLVFVSILLISAVANGT